MRRSLRFGAAAPGRRGWDYTQHPTNHVMSPEGLVAVTTYTAEVHRERRMWVAHVPELGRTTQGRTVKEVDYMVRDLVRLFTDDDPAKVEIVIKMEDPDLQAELEAARTARNEAAAAAERAAEHSRRVAADLKAAGFTVRDIGTLLGVTFQRAHQLVSGTPPQPRGLTQPSAEAV